MRFCVGGAGVLDRGFAGLDLAQVAVELLFHGSLFGIAHGSGVAVRVGFGQVHAGVGEVRVMRFKILAHVGFGNRLFAAMIVSGGEDLLQRIAALSIGFLEGRLGHALGFEQGFVLLDPGVRRGLLDRILFVACKGEVFLLHFVIQHKELIGQLFGAVGNPGEGRLILDLGILQIRGICFGACLGICLVQLIDIDARWHRCVTALGAPGGIAANGTSGNRAGNHCTGHGSGHEFF